MPAIELPVTDPRSKSTLPSSDLRTQTMPFDPVLPSFDLAADFWSLRYVIEESESFAVRKNVPQPFSAFTDRGLMATVYVDGGYGYAATADISPEGARAALVRAHAWAAATAARSLLDTRTLPRPAPRGEYASPALAAPRTPRHSWYELLMAESQAAAIDPRIVDWEASVEVRTATHRLVTSTGGDVVQHYRFLLPGLGVTAHANGDTQTRTLNGYRGICQQGADEVLARFAFAGSGRRIAEEALELVTARNCPTGTMDVLLAPDQMILQIHESIGHPLELDRILGDERNFAGTSFVKPEMFGSYRYGSELLNVTFDPTRPEELASYAFDDDGARAERTHLIRNGILERPLGGTISQARAGLPGVANSRADGWNRPPIDRMANLNLEPGDASFDELVASIDRGIWMETNRSWSIDDSRNKFQFGCERGRLIENGKLGAVVKNPNYRGLSASFWRSLSKVGNAATLKVLGTPYCGKGEPAQIIRVGHASPACVFGDVAVFGGEP
jgi:predicted Zn-dependent protease